MRTNIIALAITIVSAAPAAWATTYTIETIDFPGATQTGVSAVSSAGRIAGNYVDPVTGKLTGYTEQDGNFVSIPFNLPCRPNGRCYTGLSHVNNRGQLAGTFDADVDYWGAFYQGIGDSQSTIIEPPGYPATAVYLAGLNNRGVLAGYYWNYSSDEVGPQIFEVINGTYTPIILPVAGVRAASVSGINNWGQLIGGYDNGDGAGHSFILTGNHVKTVELPAEWGGNGVYLRAINDYGVVIGGYELPPAPDFPTNHAFVLRSGVFRKIDFPGAANTTVSALSERGDVLGSYNTVDWGGAATEHAFLLSNGVYADLTTLLPAGYTVSGMDDRGRLFGSYADPGCSANCAQHGFVATRTVP